MLSITMDEWSKNGLLQAFIESYAELRRFLVRRVGSRDMAADLVQDTFLKLAEAGPRDDVRDPRAFVFRVAGNLAVDHLRAANRAQALNAGSPDADIRSHAPGPDAVVEDRQQVEILKRAVLDLPERCRTVFLLHKGHGMSYSAIAAELGISVKTVENQMAKALAHCRAHLKRAGRV